MDTISEVTGAGLDQDTLLAAVASAAYGPWSADARGRLTYVDPAFLRLLGRDEREVLADAWVQWLAPEVRNLDELAWRAAIDAGVPFERFHTFLTVTGERRTVWLRANPIRNERGDIRGWAGLHLLAPPEPVQKAPMGMAVEHFLETTTEAFIAIDRDYRITYVNRVAAELTQRKAQDILGKSHWEVFPMLIGTRVEAEYRRAFEEGDPIHFEYALPQHELFFEVHVYPLPDGLAIYFRDISRRRKVEARLNTALRGGRAGIWEWDVTTDHVSWSPEMFDLLGIDPSVTASRELFFEIIVPEDREKVFLAAIDAFNETSEMSVEVRFNVVGKAAPRWIHITSRVVRDPEGKALRMAGLAQDVTERREAEETLRTTQNSLALAMKGGRMGYWTRHLDPDVVHWSPELEGLFGLEPGAFAGDETAFLRLVVAEDVPLVVQAVQTALETKQDYSVDFRFRHADGRIRWMEGRGRAVYDETGKPTSLYGIGMDITDRKESEARYGRLANMVPCIVWMTDCQGRTEFVNDRWTEITGRVGSDLSREDWAYVIHPEDQDHVRNVWENASAQGITYETEVRYRTVTGEYRWFLERAEPVVDEDGEIVEWFGTSVDIHDIKVAEHHLRQLLDSMPQLTWALRSNGRLEFINQQYLNYTGLPDGMNQEQGWSEVVHPDDRAASQTHYRECFENGRVWERELRLRRADGIYRWHLSRLVPIRGEDGAVVRWFGVSTDIHSQKTKEQTLDFLVRLSEATRSLDDAVAIVQTTATLLGEHLNASRVAYAEIDPDEDHLTILGDYAHGVTSLTGRHRLASFGERSLDTLRMGRTLVIRDVAHEISGEALSTHQAAQIGSIVCVPLHKGGRFVAGMAVHQTVARDWSEEEIRLIEMVCERCWADLDRARADRKLRELNADLEQRVEERTFALVDANREMEGFTYTVAHDLRAPLRAISATSMILLEEAGEKLASEERSLLERQAHNAKHLGVLIDELLKLSRLSRQEMTWVSFDLSELANNVAAELASDGRAAHVEIEIEPGLRAIGDPKLLAFVLLNLLENACKFSPPESKVRVGRCEGAYFVSDQGIGFDSRYSDKLFRPFERLVGQHEYPGTGIGLANVKRIVERHGGRVWAESTLGQGSTFWFVLGTEESDG